MAKRRLPIKALLLACALAAQAAHALEFRSAARHGVVLYQQPVDTAAKQFVISRGSPLEILATQDGWLRVRDRAGAIAWVKAADVSPVQTVEVLKAATVYSKPDTAAPVAFKAAAGLVLTLVENSRNGWLRVKHQGGLEGYIRIEQVWGA
ncbi:SH3 domain-containing protein [Chitinolyticbacter albus]|uniref:SH3 domain-containing protein n=1 Tax=Chitinolyticbacter albus TaxID=2961951 RepID=UPI00210C82E1|nr:SH3 domain-containing protein [Chitinolyticbacter albus]